MTPIDRSAENLGRREFIRMAGVGFAGLVLGGGASGLPELTINPRSSWAVDRPPLGPSRSEDVRFLLVHHSASRNGHQPEDVPGILRDFYDFHTSPEKGWGDIAYNFLIDAHGGVWEGRSGSLAGAVAGDATGGNQGFSQLVCLIGNYDEIEPSPESLRSLVLLLASLADKHGIATTRDSAVTFISKGSNLWPAGATVTTPTITGHRTMSNTSCPGEMLNDIVTGRLMADVAAARDWAGSMTQLASGGPVSRPSTTTSSTITAATRTGAAGPPSIAEPAVSASQGMGPAPWVAAAAGIAAVAGVVWRARRMDR